jgi:CRISPR-associated exonuclease Cas4
VSTYITGTLIWYAMICPREVWLMAHEIEPDEGDTRLEWGRFLSEISYPRSRRRQIALPGMKLDLIECHGPKAVVAEVKSSSRFVEAARIQVLFYLWRLREMGVEAEGELRFPEERRRLAVRLDAKSLRALREVMARIEALVVQPLPPPPQRTHYCRVCAYREFCWSDEPGDDYG